MGYHDHQNSEQPSQQPLQPSQQQPSQSKQQPSQSKQQQQHPDIFSNELEWGAHGSSTGKLQRQIENGRDKLRVLKELIARNRNSTTSSTKGPASASTRSGGAVVYVGDSASDILPLLEVRAEHAEVGRTSSSSSTLLCACVVNLNLFCLQPPLLLLHPYLHTHTHSHTHTYI